MMQVLTAMDPHLDRFENRGDLLTVHDNRIWLWPSYGYNLCRLFTSLLPFILPRIFLNPRWKVLLIICRSKEPDCLLVQFRQHGLPLLVLRVALMVVWKFPGCCASGAKWPSSENLQGNTSVSF